MKKYLLLIFFLFSYISLPAQKDSVIYSFNRRSAPADTELNLSIYPIPVKNNSFTVKTDKEISFIKVTNIIGQDIYKMKYNNPQQLIKITMNAPKRGMYLVTIIFSDGLRIVKKIMIEEPE